MRVGALMEMAQVGSNEDYFREKYKIAREFVWRFVFANVPPVWFNFLWPIVLPEIKVFRNAIKILPGGDDSD